jgi:hypothetical protein
MGVLSVSPQLKGGLGNFLFQISAAYYVSLRDNREFIVDVSDLSEGHSSLKLYLDNIFRKIKFISHYNNGFIHEPTQPIKYSEIPNPNSNLKLKGYYQNENYIKHIRQEILDLFEIDDRTKNFLNEKYSKLLKTQNCSLHIRRGDYLKSNGFHPTQSIEYYENAISIIGNDVNYLIFSDDIEWCKSNLDFITNKTYITNNLDYQDLYLMSMCENNIIANSSFSWWGAWLNKNNNKVIYPSNWFGVSFLDTSEIGCDGWLKI